MKVQLQIASRGQPSYRVEHEGAFLVFGRDPTCEVVLEGPAAETVSWRHARLAITRTGAVLEDLGSANGTQLGGSAIRSPTAVWPGSVLQIGAFRILVRAIGTAGASRAVQTSAPTAAENDNRARTPSARSEILKWCAWAAAGLVVLVLFIALCRQASRIAGLTERLDQLAQLTAEQSEQLADTKLQGAERETKTLKPLDSMRQQVAELEREWTALRQGQRERQQQSDKGDKQLEELGRRLGELENVTTAPAERLASLENARTQETRQAARIALQLWLSSATGREQQLTEHLKARQQFEADEAATLLRLIQGLAAQELQDEKFVARLLGGMKSKHLAIRQAAYALLLELLPKAEDKIRFDPAWDVNQREAAIKEWEKLLASANETK